MKKDKKKHRMIPLLTMIFKFINFFNMSMTVGCRELKEKENDYVSLSLIQNEIFIDN